MYSGVEAESSLASFVGALLQFGAHLFRVMQTGDPLKLL